MIGSIVATVEPTDPCCCGGIIEVRFYVDGILRSTDTSAPYQLDSGLDLSQLICHKKIMRIEVETICCTMIEEIFVSCWLC